jgi:hypothetical protein
MTGLLAVAFRHIQSLSPEHQDAIASDIIEALEDDEAWDRFSSENPGVLKSMAPEAMEEHRCAATRPMEELLR